MLSMACDWMGMDIEPSGAALDEVTVGTIVAVVFVLYPKASALLTPAVPRSPKKTWREMVRYSIPHHLILV